MSKHYFLSLAAQYNFKDVLHHVFARKSKSEDKNLYTYLADRYLSNPIHVELFGTGRSALAAAVQHIVRNDKKADPGSTARPGVIITSLTCYAVVEAVKAGGATPFFADVDPETLHFSLKELRACYEKHPSALAVVVQNNLGHPIDIKPIEKFCQKRKLVLIEDLAHCAGCVYPDGREVGTVGDYTVLSFGRGKSVDACGGGALVSPPNLSPLIDTPLNQPALSDRLRSRFYPLFGWTARKLSYVRLSGLFVRFLLAVHFIERSADAKLDVDVSCPEWQATRALEELKKLPKNRPPLRDFYRVRSDSRDEVLSKLQHAGFYFNDTWYDSPVAPTRYYKAVKFPEDECPVATELSKELINFPTWYKKSDLAPARKIVKEFLVK